VSGSELVAFGEGIDKEERSDEDGKRKKFFEKKGFFSAAFSFFSDLQLFESETRIPFNVK